MTLFSCWSRIPRGFYFFGGLAKIFDNPRVACRELPCLKGQLAPATPSLPAYLLESLGLTPEQLLYLQIIKDNPLAMLGLAGAADLQPKVCGNRLRVCLKHNLATSTLYKSLMGRMIFLASYSTFIVKECKKRIR